MRTIILSLVLSLMTGCASEATPETPKCDQALGKGWGEHLGSEVESSTNLDSDRCAQFNDVWCCAL